MTFTTSDFAPGTYTLHFYSVVSCDASGHGEGERLLSVLNGFVSGGGPVTQPLGELVATGHFVTATATNESGWTSEFSACVYVDPSVALTPNPFAIVTNTSAPMTVTLSHPAGAGGQTVFLVSNDSVATVQEAIRHRRRRVCGNGNYHDRRRRGHRTRSRRAPPDSRTARPP